MSAPVAATRAAKSATSASCGAENSVAIVRVDRSDAITTSAQLQRRFASRCADLP
jgi:hypothetical protein